MKDGFPPLPLRKDPHVQQKKHPEMETDKRTRGDDDYDDRSFGMCRTPMALEGNCFPFTRSLYLPMASSV